MVKQVIRYLRSRLSQEKFHLANFVNKTQAHSKSYSNSPVVEVIIPTKDKLSFLMDCIDSVIENTDYPNYTITVVNNQSSLEETQIYFHTLEKMGIKILEFNESFNFSAILNMASANSTAEFLCFLNNDTKVINNNWLSNLVDHVMDSRVAVVGTKLMYPDGRVQHLGVALGHRGLAGHVYSGATESEIAKDLPANSCFEVDAVTFACALVSRRVFNIVGRMDEGFRVGLNDIDFCLRARANGFTIEICCQNTILHKESATRPTGLNPKFLSRATYEVLRILNKYPNYEWKDSFWAKGS